MKTYVLLKDIKDIKSGTTYALVDNVYVDDFGNRFPVATVESNTEYFKLVSDTPSDNQPASSEPQPLQPSPVSPMQSPVAPAMTGLTWIPGAGDGWLFIYGDGDIRMNDCWQNTSAYFKVLQYGNVFRSTAEAQIAREVVRRVLHGLRQKFAQGIAINPNDYGQEPQLPPHVQQPQQAPQYANPMQTPPMGGQGNGQMAQDFRQANYGTPAAPPPQFRPPNTTLASDEQLRSGLI